ncbi:MAG: carboxypeptidase regulatory-like domain-containing protein [Armatimonadota bacterium]|nr:carboxypeptidase regulatory-like domain-containing protein [bacterium]
MITAPTIRIGLVLLMIAGCAAMVSGQENPPGVVENSYFQLTVDNNQQVSVRFDPTGEANYNMDPVGIGPVGTAPNGTAVVQSDRIQVSGSHYIIRGAATGGYGGPFDHGENLPYGGSLGQSFTVPDGGGWLYDVWASLTNAGVENSSVTMTLRKDGPSGDIVASRLIQPLPVQAAVHLELANPVPPGTYYLEIGNKVGDCYWWGCNTDTYPGGTAFTSGQVNANKDWGFGYTLADVGVLDWQVLPLGRDLQFKLTVREQAISGFNPVIALNYSWQKDGYDTTDPAVTPFRYLTTDSGYWLPVEAFKRNQSDIFLQPACNWARLRGTGGYDLKIYPNRQWFEAYMEPDRMQILLNSDAKIELLPTTDVLPHYFPKFFTSDSQTNDVLNRFMLTFLTSHTSCPSTYEFDAQKLSWVDGPIHDSFLGVLQYFTARVDPDGYIWSRPESRGWDGTDALAYDTRHYDSNAPWLLACWDVYSWTGDKTFLDANISTVRKATDYLLNSMNGQAGVLTINSPQHTGVTVPAGTTWASGYFDCIPSGYRDAYINAFFAPTLHASAELERAAGNEARAAQLEQLAVTAIQKFNQTFWDSAKGRYISWVDSTGAIHDWGMTYVNTIAATYGLASQQQVQQIYSWMENAVTPSGLADTFSRWIFAPRSNTIHCSDQANQFEYDKWCEDGGAILWTAYYELMSRARYLGADNAWGRFKQILARYDMPDHLVGGNPFYCGEINNHTAVGSVGVWAEFPESGLTSCAFLYGIVGVRADAGGLHIRPNLPSELTYAGVDGLVFRGHKLKITSYKTHVTIEWPGRTLDLPIPPSGEVTINPDIIALCNTYYVSPAGNDSNTGLSITQAWASIDNGDKKNLLQPGDKVIVLPGTYNVSTGGVTLSNCSGTSAKPIKYVAQGDVTIARGAYNGAAVYISGVAKCIVLDGFKITGGAPIVLLENNTTGNEIKNCTLSGMYPSPNVACMLIRHSGSNSIHNNLIDSKQASPTRGIQCEASSGGDKFYNNTIIGTNDWAFLSISGNVPVEFRNNIISSGTAFGGIYSDNTQFVHSNNIVYGSFTYPYGGYSEGQGSDNLQIAPLFANAEAGDYHLQIGSSAIDSGVPVGLSYQGSAPDRGAFESTGSPVTSIGFVNGKISDADNNLPLANATVQLLNSLNTSVAQATTDANGEYALTASAGSYTLTASSQGHYNAGRSVVAVSDDRIVVDLVLRSTTPKTYYVSPTGSDANTGLSQDHAWATIDNGDKCSLLSPGDKVIVLPGTYDVSFETQAGVSLRNCGGISTSPITYTAQGNVTIDRGANAGAAVDINGAAKYIVLDGFKIIGGAPVLLLENKTTGNEIKNCTLSGMYPSHNAACMLVKNSSKNSIHNNVIDPRQASSVRGIQDEASTGGDKFYNNDIIGATDWAFLSITGNVPVEFRNNIIYSGTATGGIYSDNVFFLHSNNIVFGTFTYNYGGYAGGQGSKNLEVDPLFVNPVDGDYRLQAGSPGIDTGLNVGLPYVGSAPDRGALEGSQVTTLTGVVTLNASRSPRVAGATVEALGSSFTTVTNAKGVYSFVLPAGDYSVRVSKAGIQSQQKPVRVASGGITVQNYAMNLSVNSVNWISDIKSMADDQVVSLTSSKMVTVASNSFADGSIYIEEPDRSSGILVIGTTGLFEGDRITLTGIVGTSENKERYMQVISVDTVTRY